MLAPFYGDESEIMLGVFKVAVHACRLFIFEGVESAMNKTNHQNFINEEEKN